MCKEKKLKMGLSSNQARFLSLTARQVDLEHRIQQICQRRLRLTSELENVATSYNNSISNRKMFTPSNAGIQKLSVSSIEALGYKVVGMKVKTDRIEDRPPVSTAGKTVINSQAEFLNIVSQLNSGAGLNGNYLLNCDIDLSGYNTGGKSLIDEVFTGTFDGNGHTVSNLNINSATTTGSVGMFRSVYGGTVSNLAVVDCNINVSSASWAGGIAGGNENGGIIDNCYVSGSIKGTSNVGGIAGYNNSEITNSTSDADIFGQGNLGGVAGSNSGGTIRNSTATGDITGTTPFDVGGFVGGNYNGNIENSSASGNVIGVTCVGGFVGTNSGSGTIKNSFATGDVTGTTTVGGFAGNNFGTGSITYSYAAGGIVTGTTTNGFASSGTVANAGNTNFYQNNKSTDNGGVDNGVETTGWDTSLWDLSETLPKLRDAGYTAYVESLEEGLRNGTYSLAREADEFTQDSININGEEYEEIDWRSTPEIFDELYKGDDVEAENKYDKTVDEINSQDKKLQLEQTTIEVEYKAISSERESVKKILDTNAQSSFKYFS